MRCFFDSCTEAMSFATEKKSFAFYRSFDPSTTLNIHIHDCCEVLLALSDGTAFLINNRLYDVRRGNLYVANQFEPHKISAIGKESFDRIVFQVHPSFLYSNSVENVNLAACFYNNDGNMINLNESEIARFLEITEALNAPEEYGGELLKKLKTLELLIFINGKFERKGNRVEKQHQPDSIQTAIDYIDSHFTEKISLKDVASNCYLSVTQICRLFNRYCSATVSQFITGRRITEAKKKLLEGKSVTETAFACGFEDYANFIRVFKKTVGETPGRYKKTRRTTQPSAGIIRR